MDYTKPNFPPIDIPGYQYLAAGVLDRAMLNGCVRRMEIVAVEADGTVTVEYDGGSYSNVPVFMHTDYGCRRKEIEGTPEPDEEVDEYFERAHLQFLLGEGHLFRVWDGTGWGAEQTAEKMECLGLVYLDEDEETQVGAVFQIVCNMTEEALRSPAPFAGGWPTYRPMFAVRVQSAVLETKVFLVDGFTGELAQIPDEEYTAFVDADFGDSLSDYSYFLTGAIKPKHTKNTGYTDYHFGTTLMEQGWGCPCRSEPQGDVHPGWNWADATEENDYVCEVPAAGARIQFSPQAWGVFSWSETVGIYGLNVACEFEFQWPFDTVSGLSLEASAWFGSRKRVFYPSGRSVTFLASAQASGSQLHFGGDTEDPGTPYQWYVADHSTSGTLQVDGEHVFNWSSTFTRRFSETYPYDLIESDLQADSAVITSGYSVAVSDNLWFEGDFTFFPSYTFHLSRVWNGSTFVQTYSDIVSMAFGTMTVSKNKLNINADGIFQTMKDKYAEAIDGGTFGSLPSVNFDIEMFFVPYNLKEVGLE